MYDDEDGDEKGVAGQHRKKQELARKEKVDGKKKEKRENMDVGEEKRQPEEKEWKKRRKHGRR